MIRDYTDLFDHIDHDVELSKIGGLHVTLECVTCNMVLLDWRTPAVGDRVALREARELWEDRFGGTVIAPPEGAPLPPPRQVWVRWDNGLVTEERIGELA